MNYFFNPKTQKEAQRRADELVDYLNKAFNTKNWFSRVHENLGWHYNAMCGSISVCTCEVGGGHIDDGKKSLYYTLISDKKDCAYSGAGIWSSETKHELPDESVRMAMKISIKVTRNLKEVVEKNISLLNLNETI